MCHVWTGSELACVDGSELARDIFTFAGLVGAAMCSTYLCGSHAAGHNALRGSGPGQQPAFNVAMAQQPAFNVAMAQVGCPDRRIDGSALRAVCPTNLHITLDSRRDLVYAASATGSR